MSTQPSIAAVLATMNRKDIVLGCVEALASQSKPPSIVVVADNVSEDGTVESLEKLEGLPFELVVHQMDDNRGSAGGIQKASEIAFSMGADAVWILDDDSLPRVDALMHLLHDWNPKIVRHPIQIDPSTKRLTWPMWCSSDKDWILAFEEGELPPGDYFPSRSAWTGAVVSRELWDTVGPVMGDLFIRGEDEEYPWRITSKGYTFEAASKAILDHPGPDKLIHHQLLGKHFFFEKGLSDWKLYYKVRNMVWLKRRQSGSAKAMAMFAAYAAAAIMFDGPSRTPLVWEAGMDGFNDRLGRWKKH